MLESREHASSRTPHPHSHYATGTASQFQLSKELKMDKTEKLIDWEENERKDRNRDGIDDRIEPPIPDIAAGSQQLAERLRENNGVDPSLSGGDIDAQWEMAESQGDEAAAGVMPTPGQNEWRKRPGRWASPTPDDEG